MQQFIFTGAVVGIAGFYLMVDAVGWQASLGVFLAIFGNNLQRGWKR